MQEYQDQNKALTEAVQALAKKQDAPGVQEALAALARGRTEAAKTIFAKTVEAKSGEGATANRKAAEAASHLGTLGLSGRHRGDAALVSTGRRARSGTGQRSSITAARPTAHAKAGRTAKDA